jgi:MFS family permease
MFENITAPRPPLKSRFILSVATAYAPLGVLFSVHPDRFAPELARLLQFTLALLVYTVSTALFAPSTKGEWVRTTVLHAGASASAGSVLVLFAAWIAARTPLGRAPDPSPALEFRCVWDCASRADEAFTALTLALAAVCVAALFAPLVGGVARYIHPRPVQHQDQR